MKQKILANQLVVGMFVIGLSFASNSTFASEIKIDFCGVCTTDTHFIQAGEIAALNTLPVLTEGSQQVLVINSATEAMRMIDVTREAISSQDGFGGEFWSTTSTVTYLDPSIKAQALDGVRGVKKFFAEIKDENASDLDFGTVPIDSAADLLGGGDHADFVRGTFVNALNNRVTQRWDSQIRLELLEFANRVANQFLGQAIASAGKITVNFDDGTSIDVDISKVFRDIDDGEISFELTVLTSTASGPNLPLIPSTLAGFAAAFANTFTGNPGFIGNLGDLFVRGGGRVDRSRTGGSCTGSMQCEDKGVDDNGNPLIECRLVLPKEALRC